MADLVQDDSTPREGLTSNVSGGVNLDADHVNIDGDVIGHDKVESAGGHIIHAEAGATVIVGALPDVVGQGLAALRELMQHSPDVRTAVVAFQANFQTAHEQVDILADYKDLHDILHRLQFQCYNLLAQAATRFPGDDMTLDNLAEYQLTLEGTAGELQQVSTRSAVLKQEASWIEEVRRSNMDLSNALQTLDSSLLKRVLWRLNRVLAIQPARINALLNQQAHALRLSALMSALLRVSQNLTALHADAGKVSQFQNGVEALGNLGNHLTALVDAHDSWQTVELELRRIEAFLDQDLQELEMSWPDLKAQVGPLCGDSDEDWAAALRTDAEALTASLSERNPAAIKRCFRSFRRRASNRFFRVDVDLKSVCGELRMVGEPLASVLGMIE